MVRDRSVLGFSCVREADMAYSSQGLLQLSANSLST